jgi:hypothetical protein
MLRLAVPNTGPGFGRSALDQLLVVFGPGGFFDAALGFVLLAPEMHLA